MSKKPARQMKAMVMSPNNGVRMLLRTMLQAVQIYDVEMMRDLNEVRAELMRSQPDLLLATPMAGSVEDFRFLMQVMQGELLDDCSPIPVLLVLDKPTPEVVMMSGRIGFPVILGMPTSIDALYKGITKLVGYRV